MIKTLYRLLINYFSRFIKTDNISDKFPVSIKAFILDNNKILFLKNERNEWDLPGGKILYNEGVEECLKREIKEEINIDIKNLQILNPVNLKINDVRVFVVLFSAEILCDSPIIISWEHSEYNFFSKSDLKNLNIPQHYKNLIEDLI